MKPEESLWRRGSSGLRYALLTEIHSNVILNEEFPPKVGPAGRRDRLSAGQIFVEGIRDYGRLAGSDEHSPGIAVPGSESGHAVQVRQRTEDSGLQAGEPLALQEIEAGPVD